MDINQYYEDLMNRMNGVPKRAPAFFSGPDIADESLYRETPMVNQNFRGLPPMIQQKMNEYESTPIRANVQPTEESKIPEYLDPAYSISRPLPSSPRMEMTAKDWNELLLKKQQDLALQKSEYQKQLEKYQGREQEYRNTAEQLSQPLEKYTPTIDYASQIKQLADESSGIQHIKEDPTAQTIMMLAPVAMSLFGGEAGALSAPKAGATAQAMYDKTLQNIRNENETKRKYIASKIDALSKAQANDVVKFTEQQKIKLDQIKTLLNLGSTGLKNDREYLQDERKALNEAQKVLDTQITTGIKSISEIGKEEASAEQKQGQFETTQAFKESEAKRKQEQFGAGLEMKEKALQFNYDKMANDLDYKYKIAEQNRDQKDKELILKQQQFEQNTKNFTDKLEMMKTHNENQAKMAEEKINLLKDRWDAQSKNDTAKLEMLKQGFEEKSKLAEEKLKFAMDQLDEKRRQFDERLKLDVGKEQTRAGESQQKIEIEKIKATTPKPGKAAKGVGAAGPTQFVPGYSWDGKTQIQKSDIPKLQQAEADKNTLTTLIKKIRDQVETADTSDLANPFSEVNKKIAADVTDAKMLYKGKAFVDLGVLQKLDEVQLDKLIEAPSAKNLVFTGGRSGLLQRYNQAISRIENKVSQTMAARGLTKEKSALDRQKMIENLRSKGYK